MSAAEAAETRAQYHQSSPKLQHSVVATITHHAHDTVHMAEYPEDTPIEDEIVALAALPNLASLKLQRKFPTLSSRYRSSREEPEARFPQSSRGERQATKTSG